MSRAVTTLHHLHVLSGEPGTSVLSDAKQIASILAKMINPPSTGSGSAEFEVRLLPVAKESFAHLHAGKLTLIAVGTDDTAFAAAVAEAAPAAPSELEQAAGALGQQLQRWRLHDADAIVAADPGFTCEFPPQELPAEMAEALVTMAAKLKPTEQTRSNYNSFLLHRMGTALDLTKPEQQLALVLVCAVGKLGYAPVLPRPAQDKLFGMHKLHAPARGTVTGSTLVAVNEAIQATSLAHPAAEADSGDVPFVENLGVLLVSLFVSICRRLDEPRWGPTRSTSRRLPYTGRCPRGRSIWGRGRAAAAPGVLIASAGTRLFKPGAHLKPPNVRHLSEAEVKAQLRKLVAKQAEGPTKLYEYLGFPQAWVEKFM